MGFMIEHKHAIENINIFFDDQEDKKRMWHVLSEISNVTVNIFSGQQLELEERTPAKQRRWKSFAECWMYIKKKSGMW
jgi:NhaP-type Na+/H+ or K+/H+ antiporter